MLTLQGKLASHEAASFKNEEGKEIPYYRLGIQEEGKLETTVVSVDEATYNRLKDYELGTALSFDISLFSKAKVKLRGTLL